MSHSVPWFTLLAASFVSTAAIAAPPVEPVWSVERHGDTAVVTLHVASKTNEPVNVQVSGGHTGPVVTLATADLSEAIELQASLGRMSRVGSWPVWQQTEGTRPLFVGAWTFPIDPDQTSVQVHGEVPTEEGALELKATLPLSVPGV